MTIDVDEALEVDDALMKQVDFRAPQRQAAHRGALENEQLVGAGREASTELRIDLVAPLARLAIGVGEVHELAAGEEIPLDEPERPLDARRAVGIAFLVRDEREIEPAGERLHLRHRHHLLAGAAQYDDVTVIDHAVPARAVVVGRGIVEEHFALETSEPRIELEEQPAREARHERRGLHATERTADMHVVRRGVVLHLLAGLEVVPALRLERLVADAVLATERGQRRVRERHDAACEQLLVDAHKIALAARVQRKNVVAMRLALLRAHERRRRGAAVGEHGLHRAARDMQRAGDHARAVAGVMKGQDGLSGGLVQHASPRWWRRAPRALRSQRARRG